jgi:hypothetical protein
MGTMLDNAIEINLYRFEKISGSDFVSRKVEEVFAPIEFVL